MSTATDMVAVRSSSFLDLLSPQDRSRLMQLCEPVTFAFGQVIVRQGDAAEALYIIVSGRARVVQQGETKQEVVLASLNAGEVFGEIGVLRGERRMATVRASAAVSALRLTRASLEKLLKEKPAIRHWLDQCAKNRMLFSFIKRASQFRSLPTPVIWEMIQALKPVEVEAGQAVVHEGDPPGPMYVVESGRLRVKKAVNGTSKNLAFLRDGDFFGEMSLLKGDPRSATVEAVSHSNVFALDEDAFKSLRERFPEFRRAIDERIASFNYEREARVPLDFAAEILPAQAFSSPRLQAIATPSSAALPAPTRPSPVLAPPRPTIPSPAARAPEPSPSQPSPRRDTDDDVDLGENPFVTPEGYFSSGPLKGSFPFVRQIDEMDCGVACLAMICRYFRKKVPLARIRDLSHAATDGTSLAGLCRAAQELGLAARPAKISMRNLEKLPMPAILHWDNYHWVVLIAITKDRVQIADPATGKRWITREELRAKWNGFAGLFDFTDAFRNAPDESTSAGWLLSFFKPFRGTLLRVLMLALVSSGLTMIVPILSQVVVDRVLVEGAGDVLTTVLITMGATFLFMIVSSILSGYMLAFVAVRVDAAAFDFLTRRLLALPMRYFNSRRSGDIQRRLDGARQLRQMIVSSGVAVILAVVQFTVAVILMTLYSPRMTLIFAAVAPFYMGLMFFSSRYLKPLFDRLEAEHGQYRSEQLDALKGIDAVKAAAAEGAFREQLLSQFLKMGARQFRADFTILSYQTMIQALGFMTSILFLWLGAKMALEGEISLGAFVAFNALVAMANAPLGIIVGFWDDIQFAQVLLNRLSDVFDQEPEQGRDRSHLLPVRSLSGEVEMRALSFRYGGKEDALILKNVSLKVHAGKTIAIVGRSGSGKTTLVKLLAGLIEPSEGSILFDGIEQKTLNYRDLRRRIGFVLQENHIFAGSILENITLGEDPDLERAMAVARLANAHEFIVRLPLGYETKIGETGVAISGGQRQRIAIARALYRNPAVLIFDEATSALDTESERLIQDNLKNMFSGRTVFVIAHRLSTIRDADNIVVLERGEVAEQGTHEELMDRRGIYFFLVNRQVEQ